MRLIERWSPMIVSRAHLVTAGSSLLFQPSPRQILTSRFLIHVVTTPSQYSCQLLFMLFFLIFEFLFLLFSNITFLHHSPSCQKVASYFCIPVSVLTLNRLQHTSLLLPIDAPQPFPASTCW